MTTDKKDQESTIKPEAAMIRESKKQARRRTSTVLQSDQLSALGR